MVLECIQLKPKQKKLRTEEFTELAVVLMRERNIKVVEKLKETLLETPLGDWAKIIEENALTTHLNNSLVQEALDEFIQKYGAIEKPFSANLFLPGTSLSSHLHETQNKANSKQLGLAQYCVGSLRKSEK